ncbi:tyrosinase-like [Bombina bombina]|uniref:tyrosinase-like n=1 Tax=Bombina bombina TaxID=8345 RepID=UPI00235AB176|nr:tyrosinase-like [Bombina bombina]
MLGLYIILIFHFSVVYSQFPRVCTTHTNLTKICCPKWKDGSPCGSRSGRGECNDTMSLLYESLNQTGQVLQRNDDRLLWPIHYYDRACHCNGNYGGFDCGDCKFGYFGSTCDRKRLLIRKEIREFSHLKRKRFFSYLSLAKMTTSKDFVVLSTGDRHHRDTYNFVDASVYNVFAWIHYYSMKPLLLNNSFHHEIGYAHEGPAFPGWHRLGLLFLERQIQLMTGDEHFFLPYYDWRGEKKCSICTDEFLGDNDVQGRISRYSYFSHWKSICSGYNYEDAYCPYAMNEHQMEKLLRKPGTNPLADWLPSFQDVNDTLRFKDYDTPPYNSASKNSFRNALEGFLKASDGVTFARGMHNLVHVYMGGTMSQVPISGNDPIFILHHCFIDKIYEKWIIENNATSDTYPNNHRTGQRPYECITPYFPCWRNRELLRTSRDFGYKYSEYQNF